MVAMHQELKQKGFEILAFPCNQFGNQEQGSPQEIIKFVEKNYQARFPIFQKINVNGNDAHPLYVFLRSNSELHNKNTGQTGLIPWNFAKFLVNGQGQVTHYFKPASDLSNVKKAVLELLK